MCVCECVCVYVCTCTHTGTFTESHSVKFAQIVGLAMTFLSQLQEWLGFALSLIGMDYNQHGLCSSSFNPMTQQASPSLISNC